MTSLDVLKQMIREAHDFIVGEEYRSERFDGMIALIRHWQEVIRLEQQPEPEWNRIELSDGGEVVSDPVPDPDEHVLLWRKEINPGNQSDCIQWAAVLESGSVVKFSHWKHVVGPVGGERDA